MALQARFLERQSVRCLSRQVRIMAGDASHFAVLKTFAVSKRDNLIGDPVGFVVIRVNGTVMIVELLAGTKTERGTFMVHGVTVALRANFDQSLALQATWVDDGVGLLFFRMHAMKIDMLAPWPMTSFARHTQQ